MRNFRELRHSEENTKRYVLRALLRFPAAVFFQIGIDEVESPELLGVLEACYAMYVAEGQKKRMAGLTNFLIVYGAALLKDFKPLLNTRRTDEQLAEAIADRVLRGG